jgi:creatinine amidohydrolase/Fe(II)-dependent formamide hydrolase-like protein
MKMLNDYLPQKVNASRWLTWHTLYELRESTRSQTIVLPICSLGTPYPDILSSCQEAGNFVLPPLFHEALGDQSFKAKIVAQIRKCFPHHELSSQRQASDSPTLVVVELPVQDLVYDGPPVDVAAFSVDTAVEEHGPHLPLATDTIQSYAVLNHLEAERPGFVAAPPVEYGHLTWGLPFGFSVDLTPQLLSQYVANFANAINSWLSPRSIYVVDVHGSVVHRQAIVDGMQLSGIDRWAFRWLHEPLVEFASERADQHAGGVETALVEKANPALLDARWWPGKIDEIEAAEMTLEKAVELTPNLTDFFEHVDAHGSNGIVGFIRNYETLDASLMFDRMLNIARSDLAALESDASGIHQAAGDSPWERDKIRDASNDE